MARSLRIEYSGAFYHIIQRGNEKRAIYLFNADYQKFFYYLEQIIHQYNVRIHAFCLMKNHYHLVLETKEPNLTKAMHTLNVSYAVYFNRRRNRSGHLFQGRYKAIVVQADNYLHHLSRYIHLNPVRAKIVTNPELYLYSSYKDYVAKKQRYSWLTKTFVLPCFNKNTDKAKKLYKNFVISAMGMETDIIQNNITADFVLGDEEFVENLKKDFIQKKENSEIPTLELLKSRFFLDDIQREVFKIIKDTKLARKIAIYLSRKYTGKKLIDIARFYGKIGYTAVSEICKNVEKRRITDKDFNAILVGFEKDWNLKT